MLIILVILSTIITALVITIILTCNLKPATTAVLISNTHDEFVLIQNQQPNQRIFFQNKVPKQISLRSHDPPQTSLIPLNIMQTYKTRTIPKNMFNAINSIRNINVNCKYTFFNDQEAEEFIDQHLPADVLIAYNKIIPGAYKADIFRLAYLYIHGGIYIDASMCVGQSEQYMDIATMLKSLHPITHLFFKDLDYGGGGIYNAFIACIPNSALIKHMLDGIVNNVLNSFIPSTKNKCADNLAITVPVACRVFFNTFFKSSPDAPILIGPHSADGQIYMGYLDKKMRMQSRAHIRLPDVNKHVMKIKYSDWKNDRAKTKSTHYGKLFKQKKIYKY